MERGSTAVMVLNASPLHISHTHSGQITDIAGYRSFFKDRNLRPEAIGATILSLREHNGQKHLEVGGEKEGHTSPITNFECIQTQ